MVLRAHDGQIAGGVRLDVAAVERVNHLALVGFFTVLLDIFLRILDKRLQFCYTVTIPRGSLPKGCRGCLRYRVDAVPGVLRGRNRALRRPFGGGVLRIPAPRRIQIRRFQRQIQILRGLDSIRRLCYGSIRNERTLRRHVSDVMCRVGSLTGIVVLRALRVLSLLLIQRIRLQRVRTVGDSLHRNIVVSNLFFKDEHGTPSAVRLMRQHDRIGRGKHLGNQRDILGGDGNLPPFCLRIGIAVFFHDMPHVVARKDGIITTDINPRFHQNLCRCRLRDFPHIRPVAALKVCKRVSDEVDRIGKRGDYFISLSAG